MNIMERQFTGFFITKEIINCKELNVHEKWLLAEIDSFCKNGECFASNQHFADSMGVSTRQVQRYLSNLKDKGFISVEIIYKENTLEVEKRIIIPCYDRYYTTSRPIGHDPLTDTTPPPVMDDMTPPVINDTINITSFKNNIKYNNKNNIKDIKHITEKVETRSADLESEFEMLWKLYPRKEGKAEARKHYIKARKVKTTFEEVESGLYRFIEHLKTKGTEAQFIPYGSTWFNQRKWEDEYTCVETQNKKQYSKLTNFMLSSMDNPEDFLNEMGVNADYGQTRSRKVINDDQVMLS